MNKFDNLYKQTVNENSFTPYVDKNFNVSKNIKILQNFEKIQEDLLPILSYVKDFRSQITDKKTDQFALKVEVLLDSIRREIKDFVLGR